MSVDWSLTFEVAFDIDPGNEPTSGDWTDLSSRIRRPPASPPISVEYGPGRLEGAGEGRCSLTLDNRDRAIDPSNPSATFNLAPMRHARLSVTVNTTTYPLFRGFVDDWPPVWWVVDSDVGVELVDAFAWLALQDDDVDRPQEFSHERVTALLDAAGWPAALRDISDGVVELEPFEREGANLLRTMFDTVEAEGGDFYVAPDGKVTFTSRHGRFSQSQQALFGSAFGVKIAAASPKWDAAKLTNIGRFEHADGDVFEVVDSASETAYGSRLESVRDLPLRDAEAEAVAQWLVFRFADQHLWVDGLTAHGHVDAVPATLALRVGDLVRVIQPLDDSNTFDDELTVERIRHEIHTGEGSGWAAIFDLSPYFGEGPWLTLDDATLGLLDSGNVLAP